MFSNGYKTGRDAWLYNFSADVCADSGRLMVEDYVGAAEVRDSRPDLAIDEVARMNSRNLRWDRELKANLRRGKAARYSPSEVRVAQYRPFVKQHLYGDFLFGQMKYQQDRIFPPQTQPGRLRSGWENHAICVPGKGATKPFSVLIADLMPDLHFLEFGQCFPRYRFKRRREAQGDMLAVDGLLERIDNVTDESLRAFRVRYGDSSITKDGIFDYVYGVLHSPVWRECFANDLTKELPRVPFADDFHAFAEAGASLAELHLGYETCREHPLELCLSGEGEPRFEHFRLGTQAMKLEDGGAALRVNEHVRLTGIPGDAHRYEVKGRTPLGWFIDRYKITRDKRSGIVNDPNGWFEQPRDLIASIRRIVHVSVETVRIVEGLPTIDL